jgi:hypothetical protein
MSRSRLFFFLFSLVVSPVLFAASADLSVDVAVLGTPINDLTSELTLDLKNNGPDEATSVVVLWRHYDPPPMQTADSRCTPTADGGLRCELASIAANQTVQFRATKLLRGNAQTFQWMEAIVTAATPDPDPENNRRLLTYIPATPAGDVVADISFTDGMRPDATMTLRYSIRNQNPDYQATLIAQITVAGATEFLFSNGTCRGLGTNASGVNVECTLTNVPPGTTVPLDLVFRFPEAAGRIGTTLDIIWSGFPGVIYHLQGEQTFPRKFLVTSTADSGPGSLRDIIKDANVRCADRVPCLVHFAIAEPVPSSGWFTIRPRTALPVVTAPLIAFDAVTQTTIADTNPFGPEVQLDGAATAEGHGLEARGIESLSVSGLAIGNFLGNGIKGTPEKNKPFSFLIYRNYIGVDPTGHYPMPNIRGVVMEGGRGTVAENVLSGNLRSGAFFLNVASLLVERNRIGVPALNDDHMPNWASGVYVGSTSQGIFSQVQLYRNVIAHNRDFGIALGRDVNAIIGANRIWDHSQGAIDIGLDGPTLTMAPTIDRIYRDGSATVIEGTTPARTIGPISTSYGVDLYANTTRDAAGFAEAERLLGSARADESGRFTFRHEGDLRGLFINAITLQTINYYGELTGYRSSELSAAVEAP